MRRTVIAALLLASTWQTKPVGAQPLSDPYQIFARTRAYWLDQHYPPLLEYSVAVTVLEGGTVKIERYWSAYDTASQQVAVDSVSDYEQAHPTYAAGGFNFLGSGPLDMNIPFLSHLVKPQPPTDYLGVPVLAPNYTFGMAAIAPIPRSVSSATAATPNRWRRMNLPA